jgi:predicted NBD/HSP70 family sugar kinase
MDHFAGLDVSVKETSVCIVDDTGRIVREVKVASEPEALVAVLKNPCPCRKLCTWRTGANRVMLVADDSAAQIALWCAPWAAALQRTA